MSFMKPFITDKQDWWKIDGASGTFYYPADIVSKKTACDDYEGEIWTVRKIGGYGVRLSAPGYMDCTDWEVYTNRKDATSRFKELEAEENET